MNALICGGNQRRPSLGAGDPKVLFTKRGKTLKKGDSTINFPPWDSVRFRLPLNSLCETVEESINLASASWKNSC